MKAFAKPNLLNGLANILATKPGSPPTGVVNSPQKEVFARLLSVLKSTESPKHPAERSEVPRLKAAPGYAERSEAPLLKTRPNYAERSIAPLLKAAPGHAERSEAPRLKAPSVHTERSEASELAIDTFPALKKSKPQAKQPAIPVLETAVLDLKKQIPISLTSFVPFKGSPETNLSPDISPLRPSFRPLSYIKGEASDPKPLPEASSSLAIANRPVTFVAPDSLQPMRQIIPPISPTPVPFIASLPKQPEVAAPQLSTPITTNATPIRTPFIESITPDSVPAQPIKAETPVARGSLPSQLFKTEIPVARDSVPAQPIKAETPVARGSLPSQLFKTEIPVARDSAPAQPIKAETPVALESVSAQPKTEIPVARGFVPEQQIMAKSPEARDSIPAQPLKAETPVPWGSVPAQQIMAKSPEARDSVPASPPKTDTPVALDSIPAQPKAETSLARGTVPAQPSKAETPVARGSVPAQPIKAETPVARDSVPAQPIKAETPVAREPLFDRSGLVNERVADPAAPKNLPENSATPPGRLRANSVVEDLKSPTDKPSPSAQTQRVSISFSSHQVLEPVTPNPKLETAPEPHSSTIKIISPKARSISHTRIEPAPRPDTFNPQSEFAPDPPALTLKAVSSKTAPTSPAQIEATKISVAPEPKSTLLNRTSRIEPQIITNPPVSMPAPNIPLTNELDLRAAWTFAKRESVENNLKSKDVRIPSTAPAPASIQIPIKATRQVESIAQKVVPATVDLNGRPAEIQNITSEPQTVTEEKRPFPSRLEQATTTPSSLPVAKEMAPIVISVEMPVQESHEIASQRSIKQFALDPNQKTSTTSESVQSKPDSSATNLIEPVSLLNLNLSKTTVRQIPRPEVARSQPVNPSKKPADSDGSPFRTASPVNKSARELPIDKTEFGARQYSAADPSANLNHNTATNATQPVRSPEGTHNGQSMANQTLPPQASPLPNPLKPTEMRDLVSSIKTTGSGLNATQTVEIQLRPEALGRATALIHRIGDSLRLEFKIESPEAHRAVEVESVHLRESLAAAGFHNVTIDISSSSTGSRGDSESKTGEREHREQQAHDQQRSKQDLPEEPRRKTSRWLGYNSFEMTA